MRLRRTTKINLFIPINFINEDECPAIRKGGVVTTIRNEVELLVTAGDIPEALTVDLSKVENIGDTVTISDIELPEGAKLVISDRDFMICNVSAPSALKSDAADVPVAGEEEDTDA